MKAICIKKVKRISSDNMFRVPLKHEAVKTKEFKEEEFGILLHNGKYHLTNGSDIIDDIDNYIKIIIKEEDPK